MRIRILPIILLIGVAVAGDRSAAAMENRGSEEATTLSAPGRILDQYHAGVQELMAIVESATPEPANRKEVCAAIDALGDLRAVEAIDLLIDKRGISRIEPDEWPDDPIIPLGEGAEAFPALVALRKIGLPAVEPLLKALARTEEDVHPTLLLFSFLNIFGNASGEYIQIVKETTRDETVRRGAERYLNPPDFPHK
jgi:hypothetical protein